MSEKNMRYCLLLDFYGEVLSDNQREMMDLYYNEDFSLSEIADEIGITRQGVRDAVRRAEDMLDSLEDKLGLIARFDRLRAQRDEILEILSDETSPKDTVIKEAKAKTKRGETFCKLREPDNYRHLLMKNVWFSPIILHKSVIGCDDDPSSHPMDTCHEN